MITTVFNLICVAFWGQAERIMVAMGQVSVGSVWTLGQLKCGVCVAHGAGSMWGVR